MMYLFAKKGKRGGRNSEKNRQFIHPLLLGGGGGDYLKKAAKPQGSHSGENSWKNVCGQTGNAVKFLETNQGASFFSRAPAPLPRVRGYPRGPKKTEGILNIFFP